MGGRHAGRAARAAAAKSLRALIAPRSIAVLGASDRPSGALSLIRSLQRLGFPGQIHPVNPRHASVAGLTCYPTIADVPEAPDVVACCIGGERIVASLPAVAARGARAAVIYDGGFAERGEDGRRAQDTSPASAARPAWRCAGRTAWACSTRAARSTTYLPELRDPHAAGRQCRPDLAERLDLQRHARRSPPFRLQPGGVVRQRGGDRDGGVSGIPDRRSQDAGHRDIHRDDPRAGALSSPRSIAPRTAGKPVVVLKVGRSERPRGDPQPYRRTGRRIARVLRSAARASRHRGARSRRNDRGAGGLPGRALAARPPHRR